MKSTQVLIACAIGFISLASGLACNNGKCVGDICTYEGKQPPYARTENSRESIRLIENSNAADPTWQELEAFLIADSTDKVAYDLQTHPCGMFAEELHNNAEAAGIRSAWVGIDFIEGGVGHALNAFNTSDKGLVYIDCTGDNWQDALDASQYNEDEGWGKVDDWDKVAYMAIGKEYGLVSLSAATCPEYECYEAHKQADADFDAALDEYNHAMDAYNADVDDYNNWISGKTFYIGTADYWKAQNWSNDLNKEKRRLNTQLKLLDEKGDALGAFWEPLGNVSQIKIYW